MNDYIANNLKNEKNKILISKINDKVKFCETKNKIQNTDFLDLAEQGITEKFLKSQKINNYIYSGGIEEAERKIIIFYPQKLEKIINNIDINDYINVIRITLPTQLRGEYTHRNYLGALMKLGLERQKIGDILVNDNGADIIVLPEITRFLLTNLISLTRFNKSTIDQIKIENIREVETKVQVIKITVASMRMDNIIAEVLHCSRSKANEIINEERVFINNESFTKSSKEIKENDRITVRGKGKFIIKNLVRKYKKRKNMH